MPDDDLSMFGVSPPSENPDEVSPKKNPIKKNRPPPPKPIEEGPEVWFPCRAKQDCPGKHSRLILKIKTPGGGSLLRYRCLTCKKIFSLST